MKLLMFRLIRRHPIASSVVWTAFVLIAVAAVFVTPTYLAAIFRHGL